MACRRLRRSRRRIIAGLAGGMAEYFHLAGRAGPLPVAARAAAGRDPGACALPHLLARDPERVSVPETPTYRPRPGELAILNCPPGATLQTAPPARGYRLILFTIGSRQQVSVRAWAEYSRSASRPGSCGRRQPGWACGPARC